MSAMALGTSVRARRSVIGIVAALAMVLALLGAPPGTSAEASGDADADVNHDRLVVYFGGDSVAAAVGAAHGAEAEAHRAELAAQRAEFIAWMRGNVPEARIVWEYDTVLNAVSVDLRGASPAALARGPHVQEVKHPEWAEPLMSESLDLINWSDATNADVGDDDVDVGEGVKIGIIDTGVDPRHPFFEVHGDNWQFYEETEGGDCLVEPIQPGFEDLEDLTSCKVIVAKVFHPDEDMTPEALHPHGNHVAGTAAGNSGTTDDLGLTLSGVAPAAFIGNYNVFPGEEAAAASTDDIAMAVNEAVTDGMDVVNLSLGGAPPRSGTSVLEDALLDATLAGVVPVTSAGNSGPGSGTVTAPGRAPWVITVGSSTNAHLVAQEIEAGGLEETTLAAIGDFPALDTDMENREIEWWGDHDRRGTGEACESRLPRGFPDLDGKIALIARGECSFTTKIRNAQEAGADGVIVFNNVEGEPFGMGHDGTEPKPTIPAVMIERGYGFDLVEEAPTKLDEVEPVGAHPTDENLLSVFSSRGPVEFPNHGLIIKPDLTAPGENIQSATLCDEAGDCEWGMFSGTSMSSPHVAGAAAAVLWDRGSDLGDDPSGQELVIAVKSLLTNTAAHDAINDGTARVNEAGAGLLDLAAVFEGDVVADPVSVSFGSIVERGRPGTPIERVEHANLEALLGDLDDLDLVAIAEPDKDFSVDGAEVTAKLENGILTVELSSEVSVSGEFEGTIEIIDDTSKQVLIRLPYWGQLGR